MPVSKRLRFEILRRDNHTCRYCGGSTPDVRITVDHVVPVALGGGDEPKNLVSACIDCNAGKSSVPAGAPLVEDVQQDALRWSRAMQFAADALAEDERQRALLMQPYYDAVLSNWKEEWLPHNWRSSAAQFMRAGLPWTVMEELADVAWQASTNDTWRYFCGCCWTRIRQMQEHARQIIASEAFGG